MLNITIGTNTDRNKVLVDPNTTIKDALIDNQVDYSRATLQLDGATLKAGDINKTFAELECTDGAFLIAVVKADCAC